MPFPTSPSNNDVHKIGNRAFVYDSTLGTWDQVRETDRTENKLLQGEISSAVTGTGTKTFQQFRLTSGKNGITSESFITANISEVSGGFNLENSNVTQSSGLFSFNRTGVYWILGNIITSYDNMTRHAGMFINVTRDNGLTTYEQPAIVYINRHDPGGSDVYSNGLVHYVFDVTNTTTHRVKFSVFSEAACNFLGSASQNRTYFTFVRMGDT